MFVATISIARDRIKNPWFMYYSCPKRFNISKDKPTLILPMGILVCATILDQGFSFFVYILLMFYTAEFPEFFWLSLSQQILKYFVEFKTTKNILYPGTLPYKTEKIKQTLPLIYCWCTMLFCPVFLHGASTKFTNRYDYN